MGTLPGNTQLPGDMGDRALAANHPIDQQQTATNVETSISVGHENLRLGETSDISTKPGGSPFHKTGTVTNVTAEYS
jgi:hypothetical protein